MAAFKFACIYGSGGYVWFTTYINVGECQYQRPAVLMDFGNVRVAFGILILYCVQAKIMRFFHFHFRWWQPSLIYHYHWSRKVPTLVLPCCFIPKIWVVALGVSLLSSIETQILPYFVFTSSNGVHLWFAWYRDVGKGTLRIPNRQVQILAGGSKNLPPPQLFPPTFFGIHFWTRSISP